MFNGEQSIRDVLKHLGTTCKALSDLHAGPAFKHFKRNQDYKLATGCKRTWSVRSQCDTNPVPVLCNNASKHNMNERLNMYHTLSV